MVAGVEAREASKPPENPHRPIKRKPTASPLKKGNRSALQNRHLRFAPPTSISPEKLPIQTPRHYPSPHMADPQTLMLIAQIIIATPILIHIRHEARQIGEPWKHLILPVIFFWWFVYPMWLFYWPGMHRPSRRGKDPATYLGPTWARRRVAERTIRRR